MSLVFQDFEDLDTFYLAVNIILSSIPYWFEVVVHFALEVTFMHTSKLLAGFSRVLSKGINFDIS